MSHNESLTDECLLSVNTVYSSFPAPSFLCKQKEGTKNKLARQRTVYDSLLSNTQQASKLKTKPGDEAVLYMLCMILNWDWQVAIACAKLVM